MEDRMQRRKKKKIRNEASKRTTKSHMDLIEALNLGCEDLKNLEQLCSIDDAFYLPLHRVIEVKRVFRSKQFPTSEEFMKWSLYVKAFYLKAHSSCGNRSPLTIEAEIRKEDEDVEFVDPSDHPVELYGYASRVGIDGPFKFGSYSEGTEPGCIPYHLYLLIKKAVDIKDSKPCGAKEKLKIVERKIWFFCNYFHSHLPVGWEYEHCNARDVVDSYDTTRQPRYNMTGYTPLTSCTGGWRFLEYEHCGSQLSRDEMTIVMAIIHSRETPNIWQMEYNMLKFYCKMCSCFGINYHRLEEATEEDVCLMQVDLRSRPFY